MRCPPLPPNPFHCSLLSKAHTHTHQRTLTHTYVHARTHIQTHTCTYTFTHAHTRTQTQTHTCTHTHTHTQTEARFAELTALGLNVQVVAVGKKAQKYFQRRPKFNVVSEC